MAYSKRALDKMSRDEVAAVAREEFGIDEPHETKAQLVRAVLSAQAGAETTEDAESDPEPAPDETDAPAAAEDVEAGDPEWITVRGTTAPTVTALWEQDRRHPGGEVFIRGGQTATVYPTPGVMRAIQRHKLTRG